MAGCETPRPWTYDEALRVLSGALQFGVNPSLANVEAICEALGRPQDAFAVVQVAGTNGKTSTARIIEALLRAEGRRTALYTSPELVRYPERIEIAGDVVDDEGFALAVGVAADTAAALFGTRADGVPERATEFELATAAALWLFRARGVDTAVLEVGLGGRWDATSVASPAVAVVTGIGLDHMHILGDTLEKIAAEKAAIIRPASAPVLGPGTAGVEEPFLEAAERAGTHARAVRAEGQASPVAEELTVRYSLRAHPGSPMGSMLADVEGVHGDYRGLALSAPSYQAANLATGVCAAEAALGRALDAGRMRRALADLRFPGRFEPVRADPLVIVDGSHNPQAAEVLAGAMAEAWPDAERRPVALLGVLADKDAAGIVAALMPVVADFEVTEPDAPRALSAGDLAEIVHEVTGRWPREHRGVQQALADLIPRVTAGLVVTGSLTTAGQARDLLTRAAGSTREGPWK